MFCSNCRAEYVAGVQTCGHCGVALVEVAPDVDPFQSEDRMAEMLKDRTLEAIVVGAFAQVREAQKRLSEARIPSMIAPEEEGEIQSALHARLYLLVDETDLGRVRDVFAKAWEDGLRLEGLMLQAAKEAAGSDGTPCPACGTTIPDAQDTCPECGLCVG